MVLVIAGLLVGVRLLTAPDRPAGPPATAGSAPLVVGDNRTVTMISLGGARTDALLARVGANIGSAVAAVEAFWGADWSHELLVVATGTDAEFATQAGRGTAAGADIAAVAVADQVDPPRGLVIGQRIVLAPGASQMSDAALRIVLGHELFHYASRADTALDAPRWLTEGVADYVGRPATAVPKDIEPPTALPSDADFAVDGPQLSLAYDRAWLFARYVADEYGPPALRELYVRACGPDHTDVPTALRATLGLGPDDVLARWRQWLAR
ncbi:hypothetical protein BH09ACT8_BH09ACT8_54170 [soil metagenome]